MLTHSSIATLFLMTIVIQLHAAAALKDGELSAPIATPSMTGNRPRVEGLLIYVNGQNTDSDAALATGAKLSRRIGAPVRVCFNDLTLPFIDWCSTLIEKIGDADLSVNAATTTLISVIRAEIEEGREINLVGHSAGALSIQNAVNAVADTYAQKTVQERQLLLSRIHVLCVGSAVFGSDNIFSDGWPPDIGSVYDLHDERDGIASVWGGGSFWDWFDCDLDEDYHSSNRYMDYVAAEMLRATGSTVIHESGPPTTSPSR